MRSQRNIDILTMLLMSILRLSIKLTIKQSKTSGSLRLRHTIFNETQKDP